MNTEMIVLVAVFAAVPVVLWAAWASVTLVKISKSLDYDHNDDDGEDQH